MVGTVRSVEALDCEVGGAVEISVEMLVLELVGGDVGTLVALEAVDEAVFVFEVTLESTVEIPVEI